MYYRIWSKNEQDEFKKRNNKDIVKSSIEMAIATAASIVAVKFANELPLQELAPRIAAIVGALGLIGLDMHAVISLGIHIMESDSIDAGYSNLYDKSDIFGRRK